MLISTVSEKFKLSTSSVRSRLKASNSGLTKSAVKFKTACPEKFCMATTGRDTMSKTEAASRERYVLLGEVAKPNNRLISLPSNLLRVISTIGSLKEGSNVLSDRI